MFSLILLTWYCQYRSCTERNHTSFCVFWSCVSSFLRHERVTLYIHSVNRDVLCELPPEEGHPPYIAARLKKPAYDKSDAPRRWWNVLDEALCGYRVVPTRADRCGHVLYSTQTCNPNWNRTCSTQGHGTNDISLESCVRSQGDAAFERMLDPIEGSQATGTSVAGIINLFVDDVFGRGGTEMEQRVLARLTRKHFPTGSEE